MNGKNAFNKEFFDGVMKDKGMTGTQKLIAIGCVCLVSLIVGVVGIHANKTEPEEKHVISVSYGETQNRGNFESRKINVFLSKTLKFHQDPDEEMDKELYDLKRFVQERLAKFKMEDNARKNNP